MRKKTVRSLSLSLSVAMALTGVPAAAIQAESPAALVAAAAEYAPWAPNVSYATGDIVVHNKQLYECRQGHTSLAGWEPNVVLALWLPMENAPAPDPDIAVSSVTVSPRSLELEVGAHAKLKAKVSPADATDKTLSWKSDNPAAATVKNGIVTAVAPGAAVITVTAGGKSAQCTVVVNEVPTTEAPTEAPTEPTTEATTEPETEATTEATTEPTVAPTTEPTVAPTTEPTVPPTTEAPTEPTTEATTEPTTAPTTPSTEDHTMPPYPFWKGYTDTAHHPTDNEKNKYYYKGNIYLNKYYACAGEVPGKGGPWKLVGPAEWTVPESEDNYFTPQDQSFAENQLNKTLTDAEVLERYGKLDPRFTPANVLKSLDELIPESYYNELFPFRFGCDAWKKSKPVTIYYDHPELMEDYYSYQNLKNAVSEMANTVVRIEWPEGAGYAFRVIRLDKTTHEQRHLMTHPDFYQPWNAVKDIQYAIVDYGAFISEGSINDRKRELAGFLANVAHETGGGCFEGNPIEDHGAMYFNEEVTYIKGGSGYILPSHEVYKPVAGKSYHGRGPLQLSWNYNYGLCSDVLFNDASILLNNPEMVKDDGKIGFMTAIWFWMTPQSPKPSCHESMLGTWQPEPNAKNTQYNGSFGLTMVIINGEIGHAEDSPTAVGRRARMYRTYTGKMGADISGEKCDTLGIVQFG